MSKRVYVGGVPGSMSPEDAQLAIKEQTSGVVNVEVKVSGGAATYYVTYSSEEAAKEAVKKGLALGGAKQVMQVIVEAESKKRSGDGADPAAKRARNERAAVTRILLVSGFPLGTDAASLESYFETQGAVQKVEIQHPSGSNATPFALIHMSYPHFAERAKRELSGNLFRGSTLSIEYAYEDSPDSNPVSQRRVHIALDPKAPGNTEITIGDLLNMLTSIIDEPGTKHGAFVDPHGHVVIPVSAFPTDGDEEDGEAVADEDE